MVPSPEPLEIVEEGVIRRLIDTGVLVIAVGGGGIPVVRRGRALRGVEAVIDKDRASALLAARLGADYFIISTDADRVYLQLQEARPAPPGPGDGGGDGRGTTATGSSRPATWDRRSSPRCGSSGTAGAR